ncbi:MAG: SRPBCC domain-containing protein [Deltaproteobacteria bacterium]|nr:SRPBCC domain-containing protein [Deltaproteobacteria bacterium]
MTTRTNVDHETFTISFERVFASSREDVFEAWTDAAQIKQWWDPTGVPLANCAVDLRPGGTFRFTMATQHAHDFTGVYRVVDPPSQLVFDAMGAIGTVRLQEVGEHTHMTVSIRCSSAEHLEQFVKLGVADGTNQTLDNLVAHFKRRKA